MAIMYDLGKLNYSISFVPLFRIPQFRMQVGFLVKDPFFFWTVVKVEVNRWFYTVYSVSPLSVR